MAKTIPPIPRKAYDGTTAHPDGRREKFCQEAVALNDVNAAYVAAGFKLPRGNSYRMSREPKVALRLAHLWSKAAAHAEVMGGRHLVKADTIAHANIVDFFEIDEATGEPRSVNLNKAPRAICGAIQEISYDAEGRPKLKLYDAAAMLRFLIERGDPSVRKIAMTDPTGQQAAQPFVVEIVRFSDDAAASDQAAA